MNRPTKIVISGMLFGILLFIGFQLLTILYYIPFGKAFNNFFSMVGIIIFFIAGFFYVSLKTSNI